MKKVFFMLFTVATLVIIDYKVVCDVNIDRLQREIRMLIIDGWQPFDGVRLGGSGMGSFFYQTMVKYNKEQK